MAQRINSENILLFYTYINFRGKEKNTEQSSLDENKKHFNFHPKAQLWGFKISFHHFIKNKIFYFS